MVRNNSCLSIEEQEQEQSAYESYAILKKLVRWLCKSNTMDYDDAFKLTVNRMNKVKHKKIRKQKSNEK